MKTKKISLMLVLSMIIQLMSFSAFASTETTVTGWHADTSGIYVYFDTAVTAAEVLEGTTLKSDGVAVPFTVEERVMPNNSTGYHKSTYVGDTTIKIIPIDKLTIDTEYDLIITLSGAEVLNKYFKITELYLDDFTNDIDGWKVSNTTYLSISHNTTDGRLTLVNQKQTGSTFSLYIEKFLSDFSNKDYTIEFDFYSNLSSTSTNTWMGGPRYQDEAATLNDAEVLPQVKDTWKSYHAYVQHYYNNGARIKPRNSTSWLSSDYFARVPDYANNNGTTVQAGTPGGQKFHYTYALQLGNTDLGMFVESTMANGTVAEFKMADVDIQSNGGAFSFDVTGRNSASYTTMFDLDNVHVTKVVEVERPVGAITFAAPSITYNAGSTVAEASTISGSVNVSNTYTTEMPAVVMMAAYDSTTGQMKNVDILYNDDLVVGTNSIPITSFNVEGADVVKVFAFDDLDTIVPYTEAQDIN